MSYRIFQLEPYFNGKEIENLKVVINTGWVTEGPFSKEFIRRIKDYTGAEYAVLANNGTLALYLALLGAGVKRDDEVIVTDFSFNASAASIAFAGAKPVFVDINNPDLQIDVSRIEENITPRTKAIMPVHIYGQACDMDPVIKLAKAYNLKVVEDAAQGYGVFYRNKHTGVIGDVGIISFFADKTITTGEGAIILTNDEEIFNKLKMLRNQGRPDSGTFIHPELGMNFRMTDLQCAVGVAQLDKFEEIVEIKKRNYELYVKYLENIPQITFIEINSFTNFIPFRVNLRVEKLIELLEYLENNSIQTRRLFYPLHRQPCFSYLKYKENEFPNASRAYDEGLSLPVHCGLKEEDVRYVCDTIRKFYEEN